MNQFDISRWKFVILLLAFSMIGISVATAKDNQNSNNKLESVVVSDGINATEAEILSSEYFHKFISGCGYVSKPVDAGDHWLIEMHVGYAGDLAPDKILVDKKTGSISLKGHPTVTNPLVELLSKERLNSPSKSEPTKKQ